MVPFQLDHLFKNSFQIRSHSEVLGVRASTYEILGAFTYVVCYSVENGL